MIIKIGDSESYVICEYQLHGNKTNIHFRQSGVWDVTERELSDFIIGTNGGKSLPRGDFNLAFHNPKKVQIDYKERGREISSKIRNIVLEN